VLAQGAKGPDVTVAKRYVSDLGFTIEGLGACAITPDTVQCWDMEGRADSDLSERIRAYYLVNQHAQITFRFGRKTRYLVVRSSRSGFGVNFQNANGSHLSATSFSNSGEGPAIQWVRVEAEKEAKEASVIAQLGDVAPPNRVEIPFKAGQRANVVGIQIEVGRVADEPKKKDAPPQGTFSGGNAFRGFGIEGRAWNVVMGIERGGSQAALGGFDVIGLDGRLIAYVDRKGNPVSGVEYLRANPGGYPTSPPSEGRPNPYINAVFQSTGWQAAGASIYQTNVNPAKIGALRVTATLTQQVQITDFPLDPRP
jgi:hypothetical protein